MCCLSSGTVSGIGRDLAGGHGPGHNQQAAQQQGQACLKHVVERQSVGELGVQTLHRAQVLPPKAGDTLQTVHHELVAKVGGGDDQQTGQDWPGSGRTPTVGRSVAGTQADKLTTSPHRQKTLNKVFFFYFLHKATT